MRWNELRIQLVRHHALGLGMRLTPDARAPAAARARPPALFERGAITRSFDTPGFRGMTFFEVHAQQRDQPGARLLPRPVPLDY